MNTAHTGSDRGVSAAAKQVITCWAGRPGRAVIFDFNGTLSDDEPLLLRLYTEMFRERLGWALTPQYYYDHLAGLSDREIIGAVVAEVGGDRDLTEQLLAERGTRYRQMAGRDSPIRDSTVEAVTSLAATGLPMGIVTGAQRLDVELVLSNSPLAGLFQVIVTEEDVANGKPDPAGFRLAAELMDRRPDAILVFEDSLPGLRAARAAGMACIGVEGTHSAEELMAETDATVGSIGPELFADLDAIEAGTT